jgi:hypothetical protein
MMYKFASGEKRKSGAYTGPLLWSLSLSLSLWTTVSLKPEALPMLVLLSSLHSSASRIQMQEYKGALRHQQLFRLLYVDQKKKSPQFPLSIVTNKTAYGCQLWHKYKYNYCKSVLDVIIIGMNLYIQHRFSFDSDFFLCILLLAQIKERKYKEKKEKIMKTRNYSEKIQ